MNDFEEFLKAQKYKEVLLATTGASDPLSLLYRAIALVGTNQPNEAMQLLVDHRAGMFEAKPILTLKVNFELRFELGQFDEAYEDLKQFEDFPYVSQKVEEHLRVLPNAIRQAERHASFSKTLSDDQIEEGFAHPKDDYALLSILSALSRQGIGDFKEEVRALCASDRAQDVRSFALMLLMRNGDAEPTKYTKGAETLILIPNEVVPPFTSPFYKAVAEILSHSKDTSIGEASKNLLDQWSLARFPDALGQKGEEQLTADALSCLAKRYFQMESEETKEEAALADLIHNELSANPPLTY